MVNDKAFFECEPQDMVQSDFCVHVIPYAFGQKRVQLMKSDKGRTITDECCTYDADTAKAAFELIKLSEDPRSLINSWRKEWNSENLGRVRLDNVPKDGPPKCWDAKSESAGFYIQQNWEDLSSSKS